MNPHRAFDLYQQAVFSFAFRLTRREDIAEDITQECFLMLIRAPHRFHPARGSMKVYLFSIARNLALKHYRDDRTEDGLEDFHAVTKDPSESITISSAVSKAVAELPQLQQEALILFEYEGVTLEEIAKIAGTDTGTIKSRLHRARARLRRALAEYRKAGDFHEPIRQK